MSDDDPRSRDAYQTEIDDLRSALRRSRLRHIATALVFLLTLAASLVTLAQSSATSSVREWIRGPVFDDFRAGVGSPQAITQQEVIINTDALDGIYSSLKSEDCFLEVSLPVDRTDRFGNGIATKSQFYVRSMQSVPGSNLQAFFHPEMTGFLRLDAGSKNLKGRLVCA